MAGLEPGQGGIQTLQPIDRRGRDLGLLGQLWCIPNLQTSPSQARVRNRKGENLVWIRRDLWRSKSFNPSDCYPVGEGDFWSEPPSKLNFVELFWGEEKRRSFAQVVKEVMAGRGRGWGDRVQRMTGRDGVEGIGTSSSSFRRHRNRSTSSRCRPTGSTPTNPLH